jgi:putative aldouronate transport system substrate-binding protein
VRGGRGVRLNNALTGQPARAALSRRTFLRLTGGAALLSGALLNACVPAPAPSAARPATASTASGTTAFKYPGYFPFQGPKPDLPGTPEGISDAYFSYPKTLARSVPNPPGKGGEIVILTNGIVAPQPLEDSAAWQQINKELNVNLKFNLTLTSADAAAKLGAIVAGGDLPDVLFLGPTSGAAINSLPEFLAATCADLTPYLAGDAVKDFQNFANIPPFVWRGPGLVYDNKIFGLPTPRGRAGNQLNAHQELRPGLRSHRESARSDHRSNPRTSGQRRQVPDPRAPAADGRRASATGRHRANGAAQCSGVRFASAAAHRAAD